MCILSLKKFNYVRKFTKNIGLSIYIIGYDVLFQTADLYIQELGVGEGGGRGCTHLADPQKL